MRIFRTLLIAIVVVLSLTAAGEAQPSDVWSLNHNSSPASTVRFWTQSGAGIRAQYVTLADILLGTVATTDPRLPSFNVKAFPYLAVGDGVANDTAAFNAAVAAAQAAGGGAVRMPRGAYLIDPGTQISGPGVSIIGDGPTATVIKWSGNGNGIRFGTATPFTGACGSIRHLSIQGPTTRTGWSIVVDGCDLGAIEDVKINVGGNGIGFCVLGGTDCNLWWVYGGVDIVNHGASTAVELDNGNDRFIDGLSVRGADNDRTGKIGLYLVGSLGDWVYGDTDIVLQDTGVLVSPSSTGVNWVHIAGAKADTNLTYGWHFTGSNPIRGFTCTGCWAGTNGNPWTGLGGSTSSRGVLMDNSSAATSITWDGGQILDSGGVGFEASAGSHVQITGGWVQGSSKQSSGTLPGIKISNSGTTVSGVRSGNSEGAGAGTQSYGIEITAAATNFRVNGNDMRQNITGGILNSAGLSATQIVTGNLGSSATDSFAPSASKYIAQGTADASLTAAQFLGSLGTGIVKNTATTGVLSIAVAGDFPTLNQNTSGTAADLSATLSVAHGGTNLTAAADDNIPLGNGTTWQSKAIPDCTDATGKHLNYTASSNAFSCGTSIPTTATGWTYASPNLSLSTSTDKVGIGTSSPLAPLSVSANAAALPAPPTGTLGQFGQADGVTTRLQLFAAAGNGSYDCMRADNTAASPQALASGVTACQFSAFGYGSTGYSSGGRAQIQLNTAEAWSDSAQGMNIALRTTPKGSTAVRTVLTVDSEGHLVGSGAAPSVACTGTGTSPAAPTVAGTDFAFTITMSTGTGSPGSSGTCTVTFAKAFATNKPPMVCTPQDGASAWGNEAGVRVSTASLTAPVLSWANEVSGTLTALTTSTSYQINCLVIGWI